METARDTSLSVPVVDIETQRVLLRRWQPSDLEPFARMNADPRVMEFFPNPLSKCESDGLAARIQQHFDEHGFGLWAVEIPHLTPSQGLLDCQRLASTRTSLLAQRLVGDWQRNTGDADLRRRAVGLYSTMRSAQFTLPKWCP